MHRASRSLRTPPSWGFDRLSTEDGQMEATPGLHDAIVVCTVNAEPIAPVLCIAPVQTV